MANAQQGGPIEAANSDEESVNVAGGQEQPPADGLVTQDRPAPLDEITVTGTRIARDGFDSPTPVSVISDKELRAEAPANVADFVNTLPSVRGSSTAANSSGALSSGLAGIASINLRALGASRTLVLFDGQRSVASAATGVVDVNTFPQALIQRVEVVTGGASSAYGSDAVSGVVNFILDRDYTGIKAEYEYGETSYGDNPNHKASLTYGTPFAGGRGHILLSGEYFTQDGVHTIDRAWNDAGFFQIDNPAYTPTNGQPARLVQAGIGPGQFTPGGLISTGPFRGTYFGTINPSTGQASVNQLAFGPTNGQWMVGGDYRITREGHLGSNSLVPDEDRASLFGRLSFDITDNIELFGQIAYSRYEGLSYYQQTPSTGVVIRTDNAYLPTSFRTSIAAYNAANDPDITSISIGTSNAGIPAAGSDNVREVERYVAGANGGFGLVGAEWKWDAYYQKGVASLNERLINTWNNARVSLATDAVVNPATGQIVCRSTLTDPANGCVPLNRIGVGGVTQAAIDYIFNDGDQPYRRQTLKQDVAAFNFSTNNLFENWAGPVSVAFGGEYRKESVDGFVEPQFNSGWLYGNYLPTIGSYNVKEAYFETIFPIIDGTDFNGAVRITDYSTSGSVTTWKAGITSQIIDDIKLRATVSRDIRAPNLSELFAPGTARTNTVNVPLTGGATRADQFVEQTTGNTALKPEVAETYGLGVVLTPSFFPGFAASVDYYDITLDGAVGTVTAQTTVNLCYEQNVQAFCDNISYAPGSTTDISGIRLVPFNFATQESRGLDLELSYRREVGPGNLTLRALATHYISNRVDNGIDFPIEYAGVNAGGNATPDWNYRLTANYETGPWAFNVTGRGFSSGVYDNSFVECQTGCPASTVEHRTINDNDIDGAFYLDASVTHMFDVGPTKAQAFLFVRNLLNRDPVLVGNGPTGNNTPAYAQTNRALYDVLGRVFRLGLRISY
ncbi:hypothetical protein CLG96_16925 [Sphingomonas oleivorans]|uniref:TonB-dependent receptor n=1 Tax=Sphingomonas oleivorans TaxID=1735121 RepID=A0A2T5FUE1_9SPHN|nr:TonB-dependent receptor [Sphingomonas oleivorans]PTQ07886.1 hypothetical protein CLG96_16925 [Sphingomonas oleivorans]